MTITYKWINWTFNAPLWAETMAHAIEVYGIDDVAELMEVDTSTVRNWSRNIWKGAFTWPHMVNFYKACNLLNLDPRSFQCLEDE